jgi:hypothetical protein
VTDTEIYFKKGYFSLRLLQLRHTLCTYLAMTVSPIRCSALEYSTPPGTNVPLTIYFFTALVSFVFVLSS